MNTILNQLEKIIKDEFKRFTRKGVFYVNKEIKAKDLSSKETIYINSVNPYSGGVVLTCSVLYDFEIELVYINKDKTNNFKNTQDFQSELVTLLNSNRHITQWYNLEFDIDNNINDKPELETGDYNGFIMNITIQNEE